MGSLGKKDGLFWEGDMLLFFTLSFFLLTLLFTSFYFFLSSLSTYVTSAWKECCKKGNCRILGS